MPDDVMLNPEVETGPEASLPLDPVALVAGMTPADRMATARILHERMGQELDHLRDKFAGAVISHLETMREYAAEQMAGRNFGERIRKNNRRAENRPQIRKNADGSIDRLYKDGHLEAGYTQGWSAQAISTASSYIYRTLFETRRRFYKAKGHGRREENPRIERVLDTLADYFYRRADLKVAGRQAVNDLPRHGTAFLRCEFVRDQTVSEGIRPQITKYPIEDVAIINPELATASEQEGVFWISRGQTFHQLVRNEADWDLVPMQEGNRLVRIAGKFSFLDRLLEESGARWAGRQNSFDTISAAESPHASKISAFPIYDLVEYEGRLPMYSFVMDGLFHPHLAPLYGFNVEWNGDFDNMEDRKAFALQLGELDIWNVAYLIYGTGSGGAMGQNRLIQFNPDPFDDGENGAFIFRYFENGTEAYGDSIVDRAGQIEDIGDMFRNAQARGTAYKCNPSYVVSMHTLNAKTDAEIDRIFLGGQRIQAAIGMDAEKLLKVIDLPIDISAIEIFIASARTEFDFAAGVSSVMKLGTDPANQTGTATEMQLKEGKSRNRLDDVALSAVTEFLRLTRHVVRRVHKVLGDSGFMQLAYRVCGHDAANLDRLFPSMSGIWEEFTYENALSLGVEGPIMSAQIDAKLGLYASVMDQRAAARASLESLGFPNPDELLVGGADPMRPEDEHIQFAQGNWVEPRLDENIVEHWVKHTAFLQGLQSGQSGLNPDDAQLALQNLLPHLQQTQANIQAMVELQGLSAGGAMPGVSSQNGTNRVNAERQASARANNMVSAQTAQAPPEAT